MPEGLEYISSWIDLDFKICYQLMQTEEFALFDQWIANWNDLMDFGIVPVRTSAEAVDLTSGRTSSAVSDLTPISLGLPWNIFRKKRKLRLQRTGPIC